MSKFETESAPPRARREGGLATVEAPTAVNPDAAYAVPVALAIAGIGRSKGYQAMSADERYRRGLPHLASFKIGGRRLIRGRVLLAWLDALETGAGR
ncbi:MAG: hypothetical protein AAFX81_16465 [Pseudomonadota bacterium]